MRAEAPLRCSGPAHVRRGGTGAGLLLLAALARADLPAEPLPSPLVLALAPAGLVAAPGAASVPVTPGGAAAGGSGPASGSDGRAPATPGPAVPGAGDASVPPDARAIGKVHRSRALGAAAIVAWGFLQWDYGDRPFHVESEGWFGPRTPEGGADKLGHFYTAQVLSRVTAALYRDWGLDPERASREGALTSIVVTTVMEVGDGFSPYGVSGEDMAMNLAGAFAGEVLARRPDWRERVDIRVEYRFNADARDISTDYQHARFLVALKPAGFPALARGPLRWLELQAGYYVRGYGDPAAPDRRTPYVGLGLNLPRLARATGLGRVATFLQFYQPPGTAWRVEDAH